MLRFPQQVRKAWSPENRLKSQLARFPRRLRKRVRNAALRHDYLADLAFAFPMALFAIAAKSRGRDATERAHALVCAGAPLRAIADALDLAFWLRKLPPEALVEHVPSLPMQPEFSRQIVNALPSDPKCIGHWLRAVDVAAKADSEAFALWTGRALQTLRAPSETAGVQLLGAYAWHSKRGALEAGRWVKTPWHASQSLSDAVGASDRWLTRLQFIAHRPAPLVNALPPRDNTVGAFHFQRLGWGVDFIHEGDAMDNCLETYVSDLSSGNQVWSIRVGETRVADIEIEFLNGGRGMPRLVQLLAKNNDPAPDAVWRAAYRWLGRWKLQAQPIAVEQHQAVIDDGAWHRLWQPYWDAKGEEAVFPRNTQPLGTHWLSNQSSHLWALNRLPTLPNQTA